MISPVPTCLLDVTLSVRSSIGVCILDDESLLLSGLHLSHVTETRCMGCCPGGEKRLSAQNTIMRMEAI